MLTFNEGVPGAGKTYDSIAEHLLPALKKGRKVYARINGLDHDAIANHLGMDPAEIRKLLIHLPSDQVVARLQAIKDESGEFIIPDEFRNSLILLDEVHEFYVASREPLAKEQEQFFAIHRHYGMDIVLMTQWYKRLHTALRARIERKNVFQKLTAVGMKNSYRVTFWHTLAPDKYEKIGGENRKYRPEIFPLYKGVADGDVQTEVYEGGSRTIWKGMIVPGIIVLVLMVVGVVVLGRFFMGKTTLVETQEETASVSAPIPEGLVYQQPAASPTQAPRPAPGQVAAAPDPIDKMTPEQAYVWRMAKGTRARTAAMVGDGDDRWGIIEFRKENQPAMEVLSTRDLVTMGISVEPRDFGFLLRAGGEVIIATAWPTNDPIRPNHHELYRLDRDGASGGAPDAHASNASVASGSLGIGSPDGLPSQYGYFRNDGPGPAPYTAEGW